MKTVIWKAVLFLLIPSVCLAQDYSVQAKLTVPLGSEDQIYTVSRVIDGDTFRLSNGQNLKLAAINVPEIHDTTKLHQEAQKFGKDVWVYRDIGGDAMKSIQRFLTGAKNKVRVEPEVEPFDADGNLIAYVYVLVDQLEGGILPDNEVFFTEGDRYEIFLNAYLIKMGYAEVILNWPGEEHQELFFKLEKEARENQKGIWKKDH